MEAYRFKTGKRKALAFFQLFNGILLSLLCVWVFLSLRLWRYFFEQEAIFLWSLLSLLLVISLLLFHASSINFLTVKSAKMIINELSESKTMTIDMLSLRTGKAKACLLRDISRIKDHRYLKGVCVLQDCIVLENPDFPRALMIKAEKQRQFVEIRRPVFGGSVIKEKKIREQRGEGQEEEKPMTLAQEQISTGKRYLLLFKEWSYNHDDTQIKDNVKEIYSAVEQMLEFIEKNNEKAELLRQTTQYYLPTINSLLEEYEKLSCQKIKGDTIRASLEKIEQGMEAAAQNMKLELDSLYKDQAMNIAVDIEVMENLMREKRHLLWKEIQR